MNLKRTTKIWTFPILIFFLFNNSVAEDSASKFNINVRRADETLKFSLSYKGDTNLLVKMTAGFPEFEVNWKNGGLTQYKQITTTHPPRLYYLERAKEEAKFLIGYQLISLEFPGVVERISKLNPKKFPDVESIVFTIKYWEVDHAAEGTLAEFSRQMKTVEVEWKPRE